MSVYANSLVVQCTYPVWIISPGFDYRSNPRLKLKGDSAKLNNLNNLSCRTGLTKTCPKIVYNFPSVTDIILCDCDDNVTWN